MRHIPLDVLLRQIFVSTEGKKDRQRLFRAHKKVAKMAPALRHEYIKISGMRKWSPIKKRLTSILGNKCWYTEVELVGGPLTIDHYRPSCFYWWLAFDVENYRVACPFSNSSEHNEEHGCAGGKGDNFPLLGAGQRASGKNKLRVEKPVILDPCKQADCDLLAFQVDGRPILNPAYTSDPIAIRRVNESLLLLNLDHPDFNTKREQLCRDIANDVTAYEELQDGTASRITIRNRIAARLAPNAPFSTAARYYLMIHRNLDWVEDLLSSAP